MKSNRVENSQKSQIPCDGCRQHHIKCDRVLKGCKNCIRRRIACTYLIERKRRGPKTKLETMMKYVESLNCSNSKTLSQGDSNGDFTNSTENAEDLKIASESINCNEFENSLYCQTTQVGNNSSVYQAPIELQVPNYQNFYNPLLDSRFINFNLSSNTTATNFPVADPAFEMSIYSGHLNENWVNSINSGINCQNQDQNQFNDQVDNSQQLDQNSYKTNFD